MSVVVKGIGIPKSCGRCWFNNSSLSCAVTGSCIDRDDENRERLDDCPLVDLGKHGDLIDRQKLIEDNKHLEYPTDGKYRRDKAWAVGFNAGARHCNEHAVYAKAVIEAEGTDEGSN